MHTNWCVLIEISMEIGMLNFWLGLLVTALTKETYFSSVCIMISKKDKSLAYFNQEIQWPLLRVDINCRQSKWTPRNWEKRSFEIWRATLSLVKSTVKSSSKPELNRWSQFSEQKLRFFFKRENLEKCF